jgi:hypothetical protein
MKIKERRKKENNFKQIKEAWDLACHLIFGVGGFKVHVWQSCLTSSLVD